MRICRDHRAVPLATFLLVSWLTNVLRLGATLDEKDLEVAVLRRQLAVLRQMNVLGTSFLIVLCWSQPFLVRERWPAFLIAPER